ncbi:MAG: hypothetical protein H0X43_13635 [Nitrosospira sp.]|nr:hypothetical protein [Nitrosospira sp.]
MTRKMFTAGYERSGSVVYDFFCPLIIMKKKTGKARAGFIPTWSRDSSPHLSPPQAQQAGTGAATKSLPLSRETHLSFVRVKENCDRFWNWLCQVMLKRDVRTNEHLVRYPLHICHWIDDSLFKHEKEKEQSARQNERVVDKAADGLDVLERMRRAGY